MIQVREIQAFRLLQIRFIISLKKRITSSDEKWKTVIPKNGTMLLPCWKNTSVFYQTAGKVQYPMKCLIGWNCWLAKEVDMTPAFVNMVLSQKAMGTLPEEIKLTQLEEPLRCLAGFMIPSIEKIVKHTFCN